MCVLKLVLPLITHVYSSATIPLLYSHEIPCFHMCSPYTTLVRLMHAGDACATCGLRFRDRKAPEYSSHLDWHYKMNSRYKDMQRSRSWFLHPEVCGKPCLCYCFCYCFCYSCFYLYVPVYLQSLHFWYNFSPIPLSLSVSVSLSLSPPLPLSLSPSFNRLAIIFQH